MAHNIKSFEKDLIAFIKNHPYIKEQDALVEYSPFYIEDGAKIQIHTVDGEYERIEIKIIYIS